MEDLLATFAKNKAVLIEEVRKSKAQTQKFANKLKVAEKELTTTVARAE